MISLALQNQWACTKTRIASTIVVQSTVIRSAIKKLVGNVVIGQLPYKNKFSVKCSSKTLNCDPQLKQCLNDLLKDALRELMKKYHPFEIEFSTNRVAVT